MQIFIAQGKGRKDRYTVLSQNNLLLLRTYYKKYNPSSDFLFCNDNTGLPLSTRTVQRIFKDALRRTNINRDLSIHSLRHSFATHLILDGVDIYFIQQLLGHTSIETTAIYLNVLNKNIPNIKSPLDAYSGGDLI
jgi:site-specific recombinase XerD